MPITPNDWRISVTGSSGGIIIETEQRRIAVVALKVEATQWGDQSMFKAQNEECLANAKLIVLSPRMLEALRKVMAHQEIEGGRVVCRGMPTSEEIIEMYEILAEVEGK